MPVSDPVGDLLARIRNAQLVRHPSVELPSSKTKVAIADILKRSGYLQDYEVVKQANQDVLRLRLGYTEARKPAIAGLKRVSKPGLRINVQRKEVPRFYGGVGMSIMSTSQGMMTGKEAWSKGLGGELVCYVW